jgi:hypothetical protein
MPPRTHSQRLECRKKHFDVAAHLWSAYQDDATAAGLHADEARRQVSKPRFHLTTRPLLAQHWGSTPILADDVETTAILQLSFWDMACSFVFGVSSPAWRAGRAGARPDIPFSDICAVSFAVLHNNLDDVVG